jgi:hypothetical protein
LRLPGFWFLVTGIALVLVFAVGCSPAATPTPDLQIGPQQVLRQAIDRVLALKSGAFTLEHQKGTTVLLPGIEMSKVYGVAEIPDRFRFTVEAEVSNTFVKASVVVIEDQAYMTNFLTGRWQPVAKEVLPLNFANLGQTLGDIIQAVQDPKLVGAEKLNGHDAYHIQGKIRSDDLSTLVPNAGQGFDVVMDLWVERSDFLLRQVWLTGQVVDTDVPDAVRVLTLDEVDIPVDISPPEMN